MTQYVLRRLLLLPFVLFSVSFIVFMLIHAVPGDPVTNIVGEKATAEVREKVRRRYGFDRPVIVQYGSYLGRLVRGDLGQSYKRDEEVSREIAQRLPSTIELAFAAMAIALVGGLALGVLSAVRKGGWIDFLSMTVALAGVSVPVFWLGLILMISFGGIFATGWEIDPKCFPPRITGFLLVDTLLKGEFRMFLDALRHLALPAAALGSIPLAMTARITRAAMLEVLGSDYIRTARAKGLTPWRTVMRHAFRNAAIPIVTLVGLEFGYLLGGAVLTETVFSWPGMGTYILQSVGEREWNAIGGAVLVLSTVFVLANLAVDILYAFIDPRVRYGT
jgi:peptide/nickel transport system permease protein